MSEGRASLERLLLRQPFDAPARERYAELLLAEGDADASREQWDLLLRQAPSGAAHLGAARAAAAVGDVEALRRHLEAARRGGDLAPDDPRLVALTALAAGGSGRSDDPSPIPRLALVQGGRRGDALPAGEVVALAAAERIRFADVVGMEEVKRAVRLRIVEPFSRPAIFARFRKSTGGGVLLYGPPGCGKTMIARAIANECRATFTAVGISDVLNMWVGQSEANLAAVFAKARDEAPAVLFFDELDALAFSRSKAHSDHTRTLVNEFLGQLDGMTGSNQRVLVLGATNMPWDVDEAMKRPGRFDRQLFIPPPDAAARAEMLRQKLTGVPSRGLDFAVLAARTEHFSGADLDGVLDLAKEAVLAEILDTGVERPLTQEDLAAAIDVAHPSTLEWLKTARNLVKFGGAGKAYREVEAYLRASRLY